MALKKLIPAIFLALCLCLSAALAYDAPDVKLPATLELAGIDPEALALDPPQPPAYADGVVTLPDGGYVYAIVISNATGAVVELTLQDGLWSADAPDLQDWDFVIAETPKVDGMFCGYTWFLSGYLTGSTIYFDEGLMENGLRELATSSYFAEFCRVTFAGGVDATYEEGVLIEYSYPFGEAERVYFSLSDGGVPFLADGLGNDPDPADFPPLEIVTE